MINKRLYINIIIRTLLILCTCILFAFILKINKPLILINHGILIIIQLILLIKYLNKTNYEIAKVFDSLRDNDFSLSAPNSPRDKSQRKLYTSLNNLVSLLRESQIENITKRQELYTTIENIGTGLIWFTEDGQIELINKAAKEILNIKNLQNITELDSIHSDFSKYLIEIKPSQQKVLKLFINNNPIQIAIKASILVQRRKRIKLISFQNIKDELDEAEMESWQKLIRVLAHEIMNSVGPITTSTSAISRYFKDGDTAITPDKIDQPLINNTIKGLQIIEERSIGLKAFVNNYRQLTNLPKPIFEEFDVSNFISRILLLMDDELKGIAVKLTINPDKIDIKADPKLVSQVIINILLNAKHALDGIKDKVIAIDITNNASMNCIMKFSDNGKGIPEEIREKIFIPFFTTKDDGSGIGLSLSRQIMRMHGGNISIRSETGGQTVFTLMF